MIGKLTDIESFHKILAVLFDLFFLLPGLWRGEKSSKQAIAELGVMGQANMVQHIHMPPEQEILKGSANAY